MFLFNFHQIKAETQFAGLIRLLPHFLLGDHGQEEPTKGKEIGHFYV